MSTVSCAVLKLNFQNLQMMLCCNFFLMMEQGRTYGLGLVEEGID